VVARPLTPADISAAAIASTDRRCAEAARLFASFLGNVAGNLALTLGARGGVYIGGGVVPHLGPAFDDGLFRRQFDDKGRFATYLKSVPVWLITAQAPALVGASRALDLLPD
jgi:glucokinase